MFFFSSRRRHTRLVSDWSSDVCSSDLVTPAIDLRADARVVFLPNTHDNGVSPDLEVLVGLGFRFARVPPPTAPAPKPAAPTPPRSEERRVGKECRAWGWADP